MVGWISRTATRWIQPCAAMGISCTDGTPLIRSAAVFSSATPLRKTWEHNTSSYSTLSTSPSSAPPLYASSKAQSPPYSSVRTPLLLLGAALGTGLATYAFHYDQSISKKGRPNGLKQVFLLLSGATQPALCIGGGSWFSGTEKGRTNTNKPSNDENQPSSPCSATKPQEQKEQHNAGQHPLWRSKQSRPFEKKFQETAIFSGSSNLPLAEAIAECLGTKLGAIQLKRFADGEVNLQFIDSLRGKDVYIIQPTAPPVNEHLVELLLMISTARRSSAKKITAVIPYYGYARQDRKLNSRVPISAADVARMIETMGVDRVISVDLHCGQIQGFFGPRVPVDNLEAQIVGLEYFMGKNLDRPVIVSPDAGGVYRARKFQEGLQARGLHDVGIAMLIKQRSRPSEIERMDLVGAVEGCDVVIVDDMIDTAGTLCEAAAELRRHGAKRVFAFATHGLFSGPALSRIENSPLEQVVVCDTIKQRPDVEKSSRITHLSLAVLIADAIRRIHQKESLQQLFSTQSS